MATIDYAAICEAIDERPSLSTWPNIRRLGKNRVDVPAYPDAVQVPMLIAARLSVNEAQEGLQVVELVVEIYDIVADEVVHRVDIAEPVGDVSAMTPTPVGYPLLLTPRVELHLPHDGVFLVRVRGWDGHYDFLLAALSAPA